VKGLDPVLLILILVVSLVVAMAISDSSQTSPSWGGSALARICDMEAGVVCFVRGGQMSCLPQAQVEPVCPVTP